MPTSPEQIRTGLTVVTAAAVAEVRSVATEAAQEGNRAAIFAATPLIVSAFTEGSAALALDWYEDLRDAASLSQPFTPSIVAPLREDYLNTAVAWATESMQVIEREMADDLDAMTQEILSRLEPVVQKEVASGFWETITENVRDDPEAVGWRRHARPGACRFCRHLASKGAVFKADTARFAAHTNCHCSASPVFNGQDGPEASVLQYVASKRKRTPAERRRLREYLAEKYPDAPKPVDLDEWMRRNP